MEHHTYQFRLLPAPPSPKTLAAFREDAGWPTAIADGTLHDPHAHIQWACVENGQRRIGIVRLELAPPQFCYIGDLIIHSQFRGQGIGPWFVQRIEQYCHTLGIRRLLLQAHPGTEAFYAGLGFAPDPYVPSFLKRDINPLQARMFLPNH